MLLAQIPTLRLAAEIGVLILLALVCIATLPSAIMGNVTVVALEKQRPIIASYGSPVCPNLLTFYAIGCKLCLIQSIPASS